LLKCGEFIKVSPLLQSLHNRQSGTTEFMRSPSAMSLLLISVCFTTSGCAYTLDTGNRNLDGGCHCLEKITAPIAKACAWTAGEVLGLAAGVAANSDDTCCDEPSRKDRDNNTAGEPVPPQPEGKPLR
jgi:hypothetical protein